MALPPERILATEVEPCWGDRVVPRAPIVVCAQRESLQVLA